MIWFIDDYNQHEIEITDTIRTWRIPKFRITMTVEEPYLYLYWNDREKGSGGDVRMLEIDYTEVVDGYTGYVDNPASATALMATIEAMIVSGFGTGGGDVLTAKADLLSHDGVSDTILPGGTNEYILSRDNTTSTGLKWISQPSLDVTVSVDGVTITGDGSVGNPLVATASGGGYTIVNVSTTPYTVIPVTGQTIYNVDTSGGSITMNMPTAIGNTAEYTIHNRGSNSVVIDPFGAQTINGNATQTLLFQNTSVDIYSDNANLFIR